MIPLMKKTFLNEVETRKTLADFILRADKLSMGERCEEFERVFSLKQGRKESILLNSGGSANLVLLQSLKNLGRLKQGDKIGFSALTWSTNPMPIIQMGFEPIPIDCSRKTLNVMSYTLEERLKEIDLKGLFITNALGLTGDLPRIRKVCQERGVLLIEDNCESLGSELPEGKAGNFGMASTFSFFVAHHMSTIEGGMICTDDEDLAEMLRIVRANGWDRNLNSEQQYKWRKKHGIKNEFDAKYTFYDLGFNVRPTEITGFLGLQQLQFLDENIQKREENFRILEAVSKENSELQPFDHSHMKIFSSFAFPVMCNSPDLRKKYLDQFSGAGIEIRPMIAGNIQKQPFWTKYSKKIYSLPETDCVDQCGFYCGNYPELTHPDLETIKSCLRVY